jgi:hypothetical protein
VGACAPLGPCFPQVFWPPYLCNSGKGEKGNKKNRPSFDGSEVSNLRRYFRSASTGLDPATT